MKQNKNIEYKKMKQELHCCRCGQFCQNFDNLRPFLLNFLIKILVILVELFSRKDS
jgi:hypothetical protein